MPPGKQPVQLRKANPGDAHAIAVIHIEARKRHLAFAPLAHTEAETHAWVGEQIVPAGMTWVVDDGSAILAYMTLVVRPDGGWIDQLYAHPDATGRGHGTARLVLAKHELPAPIRLYTFQQNTGARRFYERAGFVVEKLSDGLTNEERCPDVLYRWSS
jgi:ribosomal protein S18 acetylase RimI-like enzyme